MFPEMEVVEGRLPPRARERLGAILEENHEDIVLAELAVGLMVNRMTGRWGAVGKPTGLIFGGGDQDHVGRALKGGWGDAAGGMGLRRCRISARRWPRGGTME